MSAAAKVLDEVLRGAPGFGESWWSPKRDALVCRHYNDPNAVVELETDERRERATRVFLHLGGMERGSG
jgi:hypothetical protein